MTKTLTKIDLPPLTLDEERLTAAIGGAEHLHESDVGAFLLFVRSRREVTDTTAKEHYPDWPGGEESEHEGQDQL